MSTIKGKTSADLIIETKEKLRNDGDFKMIYQAIEKASESEKAIDATALPKKRKRLNFSIY